MGSTVIYKRDKQNNSMSNDWKMPSSRLNYKIYIDYTNDRITDWCDERNDYDHLL